MSKINKNLNPIFYKNSEEMNKPTSELIESLRNDIASVRGKLGDIRRSYGWDDRIDFLEGGLTCMIVAMAYTVDEIREFEKKDAPKQNG